MSIGYACKVIGLPAAKMKGTVLNKVSEELLNEIIDHNLHALESIVDYNISKGIKLFRISSDIIPFGSHPINTLEWWKSFEEQFLRLGTKIKESGMRVSMHPGQYTVINSPNAEVVDRGIQDIIYHTRFLDALGVDCSNKIILHIGGIYGDKESAVKRFIAKWSKLPENARRRLVVENDERCFNIRDVLVIGTALGIPVVFDDLHNSINPPTSEQLDAIQWIRLCRETWKEQDGRQKIHYSQQAAGGRIGAHSNTIYIRRFLSFYNTLCGLELDIMLEVKDKNISVLKCMNCTAYNIKRAIVEAEWAAYKYYVMERSYGLYREIGVLFSETGVIDTVRFYEKLEEAGLKKLEMGNAINTALHVWGYFKKKAIESEKKQFQKLLEAAKSDASKLESVKRFLFKLAKKYDESYLIQSYYFMEV